MKRVVLGVICALVLAAPAAATSSKRDAAPEHAVDLLADGAQRMQAHDYKGALALMKRTIAAPDFGDLEDEKQFATLFLGAALAQDLGEYDTALDYYRRATGYSLAPPEAWFNRYVVAFHEAAWRDAAAALARMARDRSPALASASRRGVYRAVIEIEKVDKAAHRDLVEALYEAEWTAEEGVQPSWMWADLVRELAEEGNFARARQVTSRITSPYILISLRADRRFDAVLGEPRSRIDVEAAARAQVAFSERLMAAKPERLEYLVEHTYDLLMLGRYGDVERITAEAIAKAKADKSAYDDTADKLIWVMDQRSRALWGLGRFEESITQLKDAAKRPEHGDINVSHAINLGGDYVEMGRPDEAIASVAEIGDASPFGLMQAQSVRLKAAWLKKDIALMTTARAYLEAHAKDAPMTVVHDLVFIDQQDAAAERLITLLADPKLRQDALVDIQTYADDSRHTAIEQAHTAKWMSLLARTEVRAAIDKVGRIERYGIEDGPG